MKIIIVSHKKKNKRTMNNINKSFDMAWLLECVCICVILPVSYFTLQQVVMTGTDVVFRLILNVILIIINRELLGNRFD